jgi:branched-chain amino acid transport system substrate-binding protein
LVDLPYDTTATDYSTQLATAQSDVSQAVSQYGASHVAVELISFDEGGVIMQQASTSYSSLLNVKWFGCDGEAQLDPFVTTAASEALKVDLYSTLYSPGGSTLYDAFVQKFEAVSGISIQSYAAAAYDCTWIAALSIIAAGSTNGQKIQEEILNIAAHYYGPSGYPNLDAAGDKTIANYDVWGVQALPNGTATWNLIGTWNYQTNVVNFVNGTTP